MRQAIYDVNIRDGIGSENSNVLSYLPTGEIAQRFSTNDDWSFIIYNGIKGYVYNEYIQKVEKKTWWEYNMKDIIYSHRKETA